MSTTVRPNEQNEQMSEGETREIVMYSTTWCGDCRRAKRIFAALGVPFTEVNIDEDTDAAAIVTRLNGGNRSVPTILFPDDTVLVEPSNATLEAKLAPFVGQTRS